MSARINKKPNHKQLGVFWIVGLGRIPFLYVHRQCLFFVGYEVGGLEKLSETPQLEFAGKYRHDA